MKKSVVISIDYITSENNIKFVKFTAIINDNDYICDDIIKISSEDDNCFNEWLEKIHSKYNIEYFIIRNNIVIERLTYYPYKCRNIDDMIFVLITLGMDKIEIDEYEQLLQQLKQLQHKLRKRK